MSEQGQKARDEASKKQALIRKQWQQFASTTGREAFADLMLYMEGQREMLRKYAEERAMPHPNPNTPEVMPLDNETVSALLQNSRGLNIVKTYIEGYVDTPGVAQSNK